LGGTDVNADTISGMLIALAAMCMGALLTMVTMLWLGDRKERRDPPGRAGEEPEPGPPPAPDWEVPDLVPSEWLQDVA